MSSSPALACRDEPELRLSALKNADLIVVAEVSNYRVEPDFYDWNGQVRPAMDFARIDVKVEEVLRGSLPDTLELPGTPAGFSFQVAYREVPILSRCIRPVSI